MRPIVDVARELGLEDEALEPYGRYKAKIAPASAGAGFLVVLMGDIHTMPGLPHDPAARHMRVEPDGRIIGLMHGS